MVRNFQSQDKNKRVVTADGDDVGTIESTAETRAHVKPADGLSRSVRRRLGWSEEDEETYVLRRSNVEEITDDEVRLKENL